MMRRTLAVTVAALGLIAWVEPKTAAPAVSQDAVAEEAKRQSAYAFKSRLKEMQRVDEIAFRLKEANEDLCADRTPQVGLSWMTLDDVLPRLRPGAIEALQLSNAPTLIIATGPAGKAGLKPGDIIVSFGGEPISPGASASEKLSNVLHKTLAQSAGPVTVVFQRAGVTQTVVLTPVMACAYDVALEDGSVINAYADGKTVHIVTPILRLTDTDDELALVIAHELAHNGQHHVQAKMHNARVAGFGGLLLDGLAAAGGVNTGGAFTKAGMGIGASHVSANFEAEADYVGMYYMARAGFRTEGVEEFWRKMSAEAPDAIFIKTDHPTNPDRFLAIAATAKEIEAKRAAGQPLTPNPAKS